MAEIFLAHVAGGKVRVYLQVDDYVPFTWIFDKDDGRGGKIKDEKTSFAGTITGYRVEQDEDTPPGRVSLRMVTSKGETRFHEKINKGIVLLPVPVKVDMRKPADSWWWGLRWSRADG